ncbi:MAG: hypothetical protein WBB25_05270 [Sulfitobacter sp.]
MRLLLVTLNLFLIAAMPLWGDQAGYVNLARQGWNYKLRTTMVGRDLTIPVHINGRSLAGASLCIVGDIPHPQSLEVIDAFRKLIGHTYAKTLTMRYAGDTAAKCGASRTVILRLYSGFPPNAGLSADLAWMNAVYQLGLPKRRFFTATSPAMGQTFFGRRGQGTHIMVKQPAHQRTSKLEAAFYRSILIEELFQSFTFGMDILLFDRNAVFTSKLQETPLNLHRLSWESKDFMRALLNSNPGGLCLFDVFMLHAVARAPVEQTVEAGFITYIDQEYDTLLAMAQKTVGDPAYAPLIAQSCERAAL